MDPSNPPKYSFSFVEMKTTFATERKKIHEQKIVLTTGKKVSLGRKNAKCDVNFDSEFKAIPTSLQKIEIMIEGKKGIISVKMKNGEEEIILEPKMDSYPIFNGKYHLSISEEAPNYSPLINYLKRDRVFGQTTEEEQLKNQRQMRKFESINKIEDLGNKPQIEKLEQREEGYIKNQSIEYNPILNLKPTSDSILHLDTATNQQNLNLNLNSNMFELPVIKIQFSHLKVLFKRLILEL